MNETVVLRVLKALGLGDIDEACACPHCGCETLIRWGRDDSGGQRWRCKGCGRTFGARTGTAACGIHALEAFEALVLDMLSETPGSCRGLARALGVERMTVWEWRRKVIKALARLGLAAGAMAARLVTRESRKASREWLRHERDPVLHPAPDRLRWVDYGRGRLPLPEPMTPHLLASRLAVDGAGGWRAGVRPVVEDVAAGGCRRRDVALRDGLRVFLGRFRGPSARYLEGYVAWYAARVAGGREGRGGGEPTLFQDMRQAVLGA